MPRIAPPDRIVDVARAACTVFSRKGYRRTHMTDVARELHLSHALLYRYVESKQALFSLALEYAVEPGRVAELPLPIRTPPPGTRFARIKRWVEGNTTFPELDAALSREVVAEPRAEFIRVVGELYDLVERHRVLLALVESSAADLPDLREVYFGEARQGQIEKLYLYLQQRRDGGLFRSVPDLAVSTRFVVETVAWFAWHRRGDPTGQSIADGIARETTLDLLANAFVVDEGASGPEVLWTESRVEPDRDSP